MRVMIDNKRRTLRTLLGQGGEARVYKMTIGRRPCVVKVYRGPDDEDYDGNTSQDARNRQGAADRLAACEAKLSAFPSDLPSQVVAPEKLVRDTRGRTIGYTMRLVPQPNVMLRRWSERAYRQTGVETNDVINVFRKIHGTVAEVHARNVVIGDFNDLNVLVNGDAAWFIDADSYQYDNYLSVTYTQRFVDPTLCDPAAGSLVLSKPQNELSDWYAYAVMLFQCLMYVSPFDGVYKPKGSSQRVPHDARPLHGITVLHGDVKTPKFATDPAMLPDDLLDHFEKTFVQRHRAPFPQPLVEGLRWTKCRQCGAEHGRRTCPKCAAPGIVRSVTRVHGRVQSETIFTTSGVILYATVQRGRLRWIYHDRGCLFREGGQRVARMPLDPHVRYRISGNDTCRAKGSSLTVFRGGRQVAAEHVDTSGSTPAYDANASGRYWIEGDRLVSTQSLGTRFIGNVLPGNTRFWVGETFGMGLYRAAELSEFFVFDAQRGMLKDGIAVPRIAGHLLDATCVFSRHRCWFMATASLGGRIVHRVTLLDATGHVIAHCEEPSRGDPEFWLNGIAGNGCAGTQLFCPTDGGLIRVEPDDGTLAPAKVFPETEPFMSADSRLYPSADGLYVVDAHAISQLKMS